MNAKTAAQIEAMKSQTFGVEIEMHHITRKDAAFSLALHFGTLTTVKHEGGPYDKWTLLDPQGRKWQMEYDSSIQASSNYHKCEMVTPILTYDDIEMLQDAVRLLRSKGAKSDPAHSCGVHIHVGLAGHNAKTLRNLVNLMASHENLLINSISIAQHRTVRYCQTVDQRFLTRLNSIKPSTMQALADVWYKSQNADIGRGAHYNPSRYHMLNLHASFTKGTIEFRLFQFNNPSGQFKGGLHAGQLKSYIQLCLALSQMAKQAKSASPVQPQTENEKFAMRTWLIRLGFVGDEFKTARDLLTRRLSGDLAWRHGRPASVASDPVDPATDAVAC